MDISNERKQLRAQRKKERESQLNKLIVREEVRSNGSRRVFNDYQNCVTRAEQHSKDETNINVLMKKYTPDQLAAYMAARNSNRQEIVGHDFTREPDLQSAKNTVYSMKRAYEELPEEIRRHFSNHVEFLKFIDQPQNQEKLIKMGILKRKEVEKLIGKEPENNISTPPTPTPKKEKELKEE
jgi:hypothetical protein